MRRPFQIYNVVAVYDTAPAISTAVYPTLLNIAQITLPFPCRVLGVNLGTAMQKALGGLATYAVFLVVGQNGQQVVVSPSIRVIASQVNLLGGFGPTIVNAAQTTGVWFSRPYLVGANEPISLFCSKDITSDLVLGVAALYVEPESVVPPA